ncbi:MAG: TIGR03620 family F420-dependent LLM class oxidoreductase [Alphaproteobacteria bacterium]|nr:TIGR03620 family F420-dependent LLM class oxidoreductase [Alphaproteobacteria bacterium]
MRKPSGLGVWCSTNVLGKDALADLAQQVEKRGYDTLWYPESLSYESMAMGGFLLSVTSRLQVASGIANIYARDAITSAQGHDALNRLYGGRFVLGLGVSHVPLVEGARGHDYKKPVTTMRRYLEAMKAAKIDPTIKMDDRAVVLAALGPKMLELSRAATKGAHPYCVTPEHTAQAREILGADGWLCVEQKVILSGDESIVRPLQRKHMARYMALANYRNNWLRLGFGEDDFDGDGSDRFLDAMVVWGGEAQIRDSIEAHRKAGADQVILQAFPADGGKGTDMRVLDAFAPA